MFVCGSVCRHVLSSLPVRLRVARPVYRKIKIDFDSERYRKLYFDFATAGAHRYRGKRSRIQDRKHSR